MTPVSKVNYLIAFLFVFTTIHVVDQFCLCGLGVLKLQTGDKEFQLLVLNISVTLQIVGL